MRSFEVWGETGYRPLSWGEGVDVERWVSSVLSFPCSSYPRFPRADSLLQRKAAGRRKEHRAW